MLEYKPIFPTPSIKAAVAVHQAVVEYRDNGLALREKLAIEVNDPFLILILR
jgi:hypothetical protein